MIYVKNIFNKPLVFHSLYIIFLLGIIVFTIVGDSGLYQLHSLYNKRKELEHRVSETNAKINTLEQEKNRLVNSDYLESLIRKELGYIKEGEVVFQLTH